MILHGTNRSQSFRIDEDFNKAEAERLPRKSCSYACAMVMKSQERKSKMKNAKRVFSVLAALVSFFTTVLCMRDLLRVRDEMQKENR